MDLAKKVGASKVYCHSEVTYEEDLAEKQVAAALKSDDIQLKACWGSTLYSPDELPFDLDKVPPTHGTVRHLDTCEALSHEPYVVLELISRLHLSSWLLQRGYICVGASCRRVQECCGIAAHQAAREGASSAQGEATGVWEHSLRRHPYHGPAWVEANVSHPWRPHMQGR